MKSRFVSFWLGCAVALCAVLSLPVATRAQLTRGSISGTVTDESGASVPGAEVTVLDPRTNTSRKVTCSVSRSASLVRS